LDRLKAFDRHFNMVIVEVLEMWTEQRKRGGHSGRTESVQKGRCS
jgi:small nuclear ribonucleoprotein (snRNP)-like protein